jgi:hypothetical protein
MKKLSIIKCALKHKRLGIPEINVSLNTIVFQSELK